LIVFETDFAFACTSLAKLIICSNWRS